MSIHFLVAIVGSLIAAAGTGVLISRCLRAPNAVLVAWTVAIFGLTVALMAQAVGYQLGFGPIAFRAMEIGAQVLAPLALAFGLTDLAGKTIVSRFAARLILTVVAIVALVHPGHRPAGRGRVHQGLARGHGLLPDRPEQAARVRGGAAHRGRRAGHDGGDRVPARTRPGLAARLPGRRTCGDRRPHPGRAQRDRAAGTVAAGGRGVHAAVRDRRGRAPGSRASGPRGCGSSSCTRSPPARTAPMRRASGACSGRGAGGSERTGEFGRVADDDEFGIYRPRDGTSRVPSDDLDYQGANGHGQFADDSGYLQDPGLRGSGRLPWPGSG